jgi:hypothetical protein
MAAAEPKRKLLTIPIFVLIDENSVITPGATIEFCQPDELPDSGTYYVLTSEGLHINKDGKFFKALIPVKNFPGLASFERGLRLQLPKIPPLIYARALSFFRKVYKKHHSEAELMLLYNAEEKIYDLWCPEQEVSGGGVDYEKGKELQAIDKVDLEVSRTDPANKKKWHWVGTVHSHANFGAYHSGTDHHDEGQGQGDAVHVTIGDVDREYPSVSSEVAMSGHRWSLAPENLVLGLKRMVGTTAAKTYYISTVAQADEFDIVLSAEEQEAMDTIFDAQIREQWFPRVSKKTWTTGYVGGSYSGVYQSAVVWTKDDAPEEEEKGEWQFRNGWTFISDEQLATEAAAEKTEKTDGEKQAEVDLFATPDGTTEAEKDAAIGDLAADAELGGTD